jgi:23S rRNA-/tRNA-specific pseudouridylate synthase
MTIGLEIAWRGEHELVVVKPAGQSSEGVPDALLECVRSRGIVSGAPSGSGPGRSSERWPQARLPHRLDRITRGFLLVARDAASAAFHSDSIRNGRWFKVYLARLECDDAPSLVGEHKAFLSREGRRATVVRSGGDPAFLDILAVAPAPGRSGEWHAAIRLRTGRYHQIRVMCAHLGAPLAGDSEYGSHTQGAPWLEHVVFSFPTKRNGAGGPDQGDDRRVTLWNPCDAGREPIDPVMTVVLDQLAGSANAMT